LIKHSLKSRLKPMKRRVLILLANPDTGSLSRALAEEIASAAAEEGAEPRLIDLYTEQFDPVLTAEEASRRFSFDQAVQEQQQAVRDADLVVWVHPDWWGGMPAVMKGWLDRVLQPGFAFSFEEERDGHFRRRPLLKGTGALAVITSDAGSVEPVPAADIWQKRVFSYCGFSPAEVLLLPDTRQTGYLERKEFFTVCRETVKRLTLREDEAE
jgi:NAD(P)H dehydrogenase (quinone)